MKIKKEWISWEEFEKIQGGTWRPASHTHPRSEIPDFWSEAFWASIPDKPATYPPSAHTLASHSTKPHSALTDVTENQHHTKSHNLINSAQHMDTLTGSPVRGDIIIANSTPKWSKLAKGANMKYLRSGATDVYWDDVVRLVASGFILNALIANNKVPDSCKVDGEHAADIVTKARVDAIGADHAQLSNVLSGQHHAQLHAATHAPGQGDAFTVGVPSNIGTENAEGVLTTFVRRDHIHQHPAGLGANLHHNQLHAAAHHSGGGDAIKLDNLASPDDNTDLNASTLKHGLLLKLGGGASNFLRADGTWAVPPGGSLTFLDLTDTPANYTDQAGKFVRVNATSDGLDFYNISAGDLPSHNHAWTDVSKTGSNLTDLVTRQHAGLTNVTSDQHHPQAHTLASHSTKAHSELTGITQGQHHAQLHASAHLVGAGDPLSVGTPVNIGTSNSPGTATNFARRDHVHAHPSALGTDLHHTKSHNLLNTSHHLDVLTGSPVRGDIIIANATPKWSRLAKGANMKYLRSGSTDVYWDDVVRLVASGFTLNALIADNKVPDSDKVDGYHASSAAGNNTIVLRTASGYIYCNYLNCTSGETTGNPTHYFYETGNDSFLRQSTPANFVAQLAADGLLPKAGGTMTSHLYAADHGSAAVDMVVNVCYGTGNPPVANTTTIGTLFIKYTA